VIDGLRRIATAIAYLLLLAVLATGGAGVVATWTHPPGTAARAELTYGGDAILARSLDHARQDLAAIADDVDQLALFARGALGALTADDRIAFADALNRGTAMVTTVAGASSTLRASLDALPGGGPEDATAYGGDLLARRAAMLAALDATESLGRSWASLTSGSTTAAQLLDLLDQHDTTVAGAAAKGRASDYAGALPLLASALATLDAAVAIRDQVANVADVSTLDDWISRNRRYDRALTGLYTALRDSGGKVTSVVIAAYREEGVARTGLPPDTRALVVIIADIGRGGLNQAVISIEQARGRLTLALEAVTADAGLARFPA
jgi:hypothetical protein